MITNQLNFLGNYRHASIYDVQQIEAPFVGFPAENWICFGIANDDFDSELVDQFVTYCASSGLYEFVAQGLYGEKLHDWFDEQLVWLKANSQAYSAKEVVTIWCDGQENCHLKDAAWDCLHRSFTSAATDTTATKIVFISFDGRNYRTQLASMLEDSGLDYANPARESLA